MRRLFVLPALLVIVGLVLTGCASKSSKHASLNPFAGKGSPYYKGKGPIPMGGGQYMVGKPYQVAGRWFTPEENPRYDKTGVASWYGEAFHRRMTSNGEWFDMNQLTAAHATLPLPSYVKVTNLDNGREVVVRVNDRGPFVGTRVIDLSKKSAEVLAYKGKGTAHVRVQYIGPAPLDDNGKHLMAMNQELQRGTPLRQMIAAANHERGSIQVAHLLPRKQTPVQVAVKQEVPSGAAPSQTVVAEPVPKFAAFHPPKSAAPPAQSGLADVYFVQVGSYSNPANAEKARNELASAWPVQVIEVPGNGGTLYRVRLGPIASLDDADTALDQAIYLGHADAHVVVSHSMQAAL